MRRLVAISGVPGVGKTSAASCVAARIGAVHLSIDAVEESMLGCGLPAGWQVGVAAYETVRAMAVLNLRLGLDVVVDAVNDSDAARQTWRAAAEAANAHLLFVHLVVSDVREHERRLSGRDRGFSHVREPAWQQVKERLRSYEPWLDDHVEIDTATRSVDEVGGAVLAQFALP